jgi:hypothetical protein
MGEFLFPFTGSQNMISSVLECPDYLNVESAFSAVTYTVYNGVLLRRRTIEVT